MRDRHEPAGDAAGGGELSADRHEPPHLRGAHADGNALAFVDALLASPGVELATLGPEWPLMRRLCLDKPLTGNALPDAWLAAAVMQHGEHLVTFDSDFKKLLPRNQLTVLATA